MTEPHGADAILPWITGGAFALALALGVVHFLSPAALTHTASHTAEPANGPSTTGSVSPMPGAPANLR